MVGGRLIAVIQQWKANDITRPTPAIRVSLTRRRHQAQQRLFNVRLETQLALERSERVSRRTQSHS